jgi:hypothetical protein
MPTPVFGKLTIATKSDQRLYSQQTKSSDEQDLAGSPPAPFSSSCDQASSANSFASPPHVVASCLKQVEEKKVLNYAQREA